MEGHSPLVLTRSGPVKWFDQSRGFGFIRSDDGGPDILLHVNVLRSFGQASVADGARVAVEAQATPRGMQAVRVLSIDAPDLPRSDNAAILEEIEELAQDGALEPARVKWFDRQKGFGFANVFGARADVFLHAEVLRRAGLADLQAGEAIAVRVADGRRGKMAVEVRPWDSGLQD